MLKRFKTLFILSFVSFLIPGISFLIIPVLDGGTKVFIKIAGCVFAAFFWIGLICGFICFMKLRKVTVKIEAILKKSNQRTLETGRCGMFLLFKNKYAMVADIIMFAAALVFIFVMFINPASDIISIFSLVILYFSVVCHSFFNGKIFMYLLQYVKYQKRKQRNV